MVPLRKHISISMLILIASCGGGGAGEPTSDGSGPAFISVRVTNSKSANVKTELGRIVKYQVTVEGEDIEEPITAEFDGAEEEGVIEDVPKGPDRVVKVVAVNPSSLAIRAGETLGVDIGEGDNLVEVDLESVPIFTNLQNGGVVENTRLVFKVFAETENPVVIDDETNGVQTSLVSASSSAPDVSFDSATGLGSLAPKVLPAGKHKFVVRDAATGRASHVNVKVVDGTKRKPAPLVSSAFVAEGVVNVISPLE